MDTGTTRVWFPAIRAWLERKLGPWLPPHPSRVVLGAAMAGLLASTLWMTGLGVVRLGVVIWGGVQSLSASIGQSVTELSAPRPVPEVVPASPASPAVTPPKTPPVVTPSQTPPLPPATTSPATSSPVTTSPATASLAPAKPAVPYPVITDPFVVRENIVPDALPYTEREGAGPGEIARQVDFALMQALARLGVDGSRLDVLHSEPVVTPQGTFTRQRLRLYLSNGNADTLLALHEAMQAWADQATLEVVYGGVWTVADKLPETAFAGAGQGAAAPATAAPATAVPATAVAGGAVRSGLLARVRIGETVSHELFVTPVGKVFVPPPPDGEPRLAIVIDDMGASPEALRALLELDLPIAISVIPHLRFAAETARQAHEAGHEVLVHQPMEPMQTPYVKPGPDALVVGMSREALATAMNSAIRKVPFATGLNNHMGSRLTSDAASSRGVVETAAAAGLFVLDSLTHAGSVLYAEAQKQRLMAFRRDFFLDDGLTTVRSVRKVLEQAESLARRNGQAIVIGHPKAETLAALKAWAHERDASVAVVPLRYMK